MNRKEIKAKAKEIAFNNKWNIWKATLFYLLIYLKLKKSTDTGKIGC